MKIITNTIIKNGMPFIPYVLRAVEPFVDRMIITVSEKSTDGTAEEVARFALENSKIYMDRENVSNPGELTQIRQHQIELSLGADWIWFLDDDDFWTSDQIKGCIKAMQQAGDDIDAFSVNPYQVLDKDHEDARWINKKYFTKFFRNVDINYQGAWPRDLIYKGDELLYHKSNPRNQVLPYKFWHLAAVKGYSFRKNDLTNFNDLKGKMVPLKQPLPKELAQLL